MAKVNLKINNIPVSVEEGSTILEAAKAAGVRIPTLCYLKDINAIGACRVCVCEVKGARSLVASCVYPVSEGMEVFTNTPKVMASRKTTVELILSDHDQDCLSCARNNNCELQRLSLELGCDGHKYKGVKNKYIIDSSTPYISASIPSVMVSRSSSEIPILSKNCVTCGSFIFFAQTRHRPRLTCFPVLSICVINTVAIRL